MSFHVGRYVLDGLKNTFKNIPMSAFTAQGVQDGNTVLYSTVDGRGEWKLPIAAAPVDPQFDNSAISAPSGTLASGSSFSFKSGGGTSGAWGIVEVVDIANGMDLNADIKITWGGIQMTRKGGVYNNGITNYGFSMVFELNGIPGGNQDIIVTVTQSGQTFAGYASSYSYTNVAATSGLVTAYGSGSPSLTVTAEHTNDLVWGSVCTGPNTMTSPLPGVTARQHSPSFPYFYAGDHRGTATFGATSSAVGWSAAGMVLIAAQSASPIGGVEPVTVKIANYAASPGEMVPVDASSGTIAIQLPTAPNDGQNVVIKKIDSSTNTVTFNCGGSDVINIAGTTTGTLSLKNQAVRLQYYVPTSTWYVLSADPGQLDTRYAPLDLFAILPSPYTLTSTTALQQIFNTTTNGALTLPVGDYFFECEFALSSLSATSGYFSFGFGGTAVITQSWMSVATKGTSSATIISATANNTALVLANTNTNGTAMIRGRVTVTTAGSIIPSVSLSVAAAAVVAAGAIFRLTDVKSSASYAGAWS